jgi:hypothetical protein
VTKHTCSVGVSSGRQIEAPVSYVCLDRTVVSGEICENSSTLSLPDRPGA